MKRFTFSAYFSGASPHEEEFIIEGESREVAEMRVRDEIRLTMGRPENLFLMRDGSKGQYSTFGGLTLMKTEILN